MVTSASHLSRVGAPHAPAHHVTPADLAVLYNPRTGGYRGVYCRGGNDRPCRTVQWVARALHQTSGRYIRVRSPDGSAVFADPKSAAVALVVWWKATYGETAWVGVFRRRFVKPWKVVPEASGGVVVRGGKRVVLAAGQVGYRLLVWEFGRLRCIPPPDPRADFFASKAAAAAYFPVWSAGKYGDTFSVALRAGEERAG